MIKRMDTGPHRFKMEEWISSAPFERLLNIEIIKAERGTALLVMPFKAELAQGAGLMHGGALVSLADTAVAMAIKSVLAVGTHFGTVSCNCEFLHPVKQGIVKAEAEIVQVEDRTIEAKAILFDGGNRKVMRFNATFKVAKDARIEGVQFADVE